MSLDHDILPRRVRENPWRRDFPKNGLSRSALTSLASEARWDESCCLNHFRQVFCKPGSRLIKMRIQIKHKSSATLMMIIIHIFLTRIEKCSCPSHYMPLKIFKYKGRGDPAKPLNSYQTNMSLKGVFSVVKCRAFHLTLSEIVEIWYSRIPTSSIRSWPEFKRAILKQFVTSKERKAHIQHLEDMKQQPEETLKSFLAHFTNEMTYFMQVTDREAILALRAGLNVLLFRYLRIILF